MSKIYLLSNTKYSGIENIPILKIEYIEQNIDFSKYDALVVTSKNAVYSVNSFTNKWKEVPCFAIAKKTANIVSNLGGSIQFVGKSGHGDEFANEISPLLKNKEVLYLKAVKVVSNLIDILKNNSIKLDVYDVYKTVLNDELNAKELEKNSIIIFTSPSSVKYFFEKFSWDNSFKAIAIGKTTAKHFPENIEYRISTTTSVEDCIKEAKLINQKL